jgi:hypothetical protein
VLQWELAELHPETRVAIIHIFCKCFHYVFRALCACNETRCILILFRYRRASGVGCDSHVHSALMLQILRAAVLRSILLLTVAYMYMCRLIDTALPTSVCRSLPNAG